jgi:hypothetical protein
VQAHSEARTGGIVFLFTNKNGSGEMPKPISTQTNDLPSEKKRSANSEIYQIYYSSETKQQNDAGFLPMNNLSNTRPDWREYWPIRNFLLNQALDENKIYGFFSPKFKEKTGLNSEAVLAFIDEHDADVYLFSPFFDQSAFFLNVFFQAESNHPGIHQTLDDCFYRLNSEASIADMVMDSSNTVFCNYFAAKPAFWKKWLSYCEEIFTIAESQLSELGAHLNENVSHNPPAPAKVFVIERVASFLLATERWRTATFNPMTLCFSISSISNYKQELVIMDALKAAYLHQKFPEHIEMHQFIRNSIIRMINETISSTSTPPKRSYSFWKFKFRSGLK